MTKNFILASGIVSAILLVTTQNKALAYRGDPNVQGPNCTTERHEAISKAIESGDYETWNNLKQGRGRVSQVINKDNFAKFAQAYKLAKEGKLEEAAKIRAELGLGFGGNGGVGNWRQQKTNNGNWKGGWK